MLRGWIDGTLGTGHQVGPGLSGTGQRAVRATNVEICMCVWELVRSRISDWGHVLGPSRIRADVEASFVVGPPDLDAVEKSNDGEIG